VAYEVIPEQLPAPAVDVTFSNQDGDDETLRQVPLPWTGGTFVPVGAQVSLSAKVNQVGGPGFSCVVRLNGLRHRSGARPVTEGNDIVGFECNVGPLTAKPFP
jgi:hypothetical protein